jgi:hypothetical protein
MELHSVRTFVSSFTEHNVFKFHPCCSTPFHGEKYFTVWGNIDLFFQARMLIIEMYKTEKVERKMHLLAS